MFLAVAQSADDPLLPGIGGVPCTQWAYMRQ